MVLLNYRRVNDNILVIHLSEKGCVDFLHEQEILLSLR